MQRTAITELFEVQGGTKGRRAINNIPGQLLAIKRKQPWELIKTDFRKQRTRQKDIKKQESYTCKYTYRELRQMQLQKNK